MIVLSCYIEFCIPNTEMQVIKNFRWYRPEKRDYYIIIQNEFQVPNVLQYLSSQKTTSGFLYIPTNIVGFGIASPRDYRTDR
jgi:hypothetical protein